LILSSQLEPFSEHVKELKLSTQLSVVIPLYNSAEILPHLLDRLEAALPRVASEYEIILVNDGSRDETWARVQEQLPKRSRVVALNMMRNYGQHNALLAGIRLARYALCVTMDDDLQNPPEEIPKLLAALAPEVDVVYGAPMREQHNLARDLASRVTKLVLSRSMNVAAAEQVSAFRLFRT
jgi:glycosyltransferase involved in cell wall biosynthesis